jgi:hypothetical protein
MRFLVEGAGEAAPPSDEALYRDALALGLDRDDVLVRRILVQEQRLLLKRSTADPAPGDAELQAYLDRHRDRYAQPARVSFWHVFLARDRRGSTTDRDAHALLARLRALAKPPAEAEQLGDPFPLGAHLRAQSPRDLARMFGAEFASAIVALEPGSWVGPVRSPFGLHLVRIEEREPEQRAELQAVRSRVLAQLLEERHAALLVEAIRGLRGKYEIRVEGAATEERG